MRTRERTREVEIGGRTVRVVERVTLAGAGGFAWASLAPVAVVIDGVETRLDEA